MESYTGQEIQKGESRYYKFLDVISGVIFGGLITLGIVFLIKLLLLNP